MRLRGGTKGDDAGARDSSVAVMTCHAAEALMARGTRAAEQLLNMKVPARFRLIPKRKEK